MPDHIHALLAFPQNENMTKVVADWKRFTARKAGIDWQKGFFDHRLRHDESFEEKAHYIRMNPVRKELIKSAEDWPYVWAFDGRDGSPSRPPSHPPSRPQPTTNADTPVGTAVPAVRKAEERMQNSKRCGDGRLGEASLPAASDTKTAQSDGTE